MRAIAPSFSHVNLQRKKDGVRDEKWAKPFPLESVLKSEAKFVETYDEWVKDVAHLLYRNRNLTLFYRGQDRDHRLEEKTTILPTIFRKKRSADRLVLKARFKNLEDKVDALRAVFKAEEIRLAGTLMLNKYPEIAWSLLQHYVICETPLLDLTHSLHVACSFAFDKNKGDTGVVYVLGMPWQTDAIGYNSYEELVNIRLLSICPPQAQRPFFQEGYLAGPFPNYQLDNPDRVDQFDFGRRLIAKFEIPVKGGRFWGKGFGRIPHGKLYQEDDRVRRICERINA